MKGQLTVEKLIALGVINEFLDFYYSLCNEVYIVLTDNFMGYDLRNFCKIISGFLVVKKYIFHECFFIGLSVRNKKLLFLWLLTNSNIIQNEKIKIPVQSDYIPAPFEEFLDIFYTCVLEKVNEKECKRAETEISLQATNEGICKRMNELSNSIQPVDMDNAVYYSETYRIHIYKNFSQLKCARDRHSIVYKGVCVYNLDNKPVILPLFYCNICNRFFVNYYTLSSIEQSHGTLMFKHSKLYEVSFNNEESVLHSYGYNVINGKLSIEQRHNILKFLLDNQLMSKFEISCDINNALNIFKNRKSHINACRKWIDDLKFVQDYNFEKQPFIKGELKWK